MHKQGEMKYENKGGVMAGCIDHFHLPSQVNKVTPGFRMKGRSFGCFKE